MSCFRVLTQRSKFWLICFCWLTMLSLALRQTLQQINKTYWVWCQHSNSQYSFYKFSLKPICEEFPVSTFVQKYANALDPNRKQKCTLSRQKYDPTLKLIADGLLAALSRALWTNEIKAFFMSSTHFSISHHHQPHHHHHHHDHHQVTRLAYESHLRRGHSAKARDYQPQIRLKRRFVRYISSFKNIYQNQKYIRILSFKNTSKSEMYQKSDT